MANNSYDYLWYSSAKEGLACTMILMDFLHSDVGVSKKGKEKNLVQLRN
ncbi:MAG: hypothetical protein JSY10_27230 [Paenibacillus sp.]|nr:hypothetical protein [Paenibacillus sp.]